MRVCSVSGCPTIYPRDEGSRCKQHRRAADKARGDRGYSTPAHKRFRRAVLERDVICVICGVALATVADHYPLSRRELIERGMNPNDPQHGRGLDAVCHNKETAIHQPGGWNAQH